MSSTRLNCCSLFDFVRLSEIEKKHAVIGLRSWDDIPEPSKIDFIMALQDQLWGYGSILNLYDDIIAFAKTECPSDVSIEEWNSEWLGVLWTYFANNPDTYLDLELTPVNIASQLPKNCSYTINDSEILVK